MALDTWVLGTSFAHKHKHELIYEWNNQGVCHQL